MAAPEYLELSAERRIAYHRLAPAGEGSGRPGVLFLGGFVSDMTGTKAVWLEDWARARGRGFLRFDYRGHGASSGAFVEGAIGDWADDAAAIVAERTEGPQVLVGSSMGGWIALLLARRMPERIAGLVGIAAAPDFLEDSIWEEMTVEQKMALTREGAVRIPSDHDDEGYVVTRRMIEEARHHLVLRQPLGCPFPVRLLHGTADTDVEPAVGVRLLDHMDCPDARLVLVKGAGHRFSGEAELALIGASIEEISGG
ncbi:MAG TPA: alpha/beta hydrolase [Thermohalobaculum sp.]|nr:alpha/beta hydrolase [Thermohalobaculum sp.]